MRLPVALAALGLGPAGAVAMAVGCGGPAFTTGSADASVLPSDAPSSAGGGFCALDAGAHTFCDDFDGEPFATVWSSIDQSGGTITTDSSLFLSSPHSLGSTITPSGLAVTNRARVVHTFGPQASRLVVSFAMHLDAVADKPAMGGGSFALVSIGPSYSIGIDANTQNVGYFENILPDGGAFPISLSNKAMVPTSGVLGTWAVFVLDIDLSHAKLSISINGTSEVAGAPITPPAPGQPVSVYLGAQGRNFATSAGAHYDNVTVDVTP